MLYFLKSYEIPLAYRARVGSIKKVKSNFIDGTYGVYPEIEWLKEHDCKIELVMKILPSKYFHDYRRTKYYIDLDLLSNAKALWFLLVYKGTRNE